MSSYYIGVDVGSASVRAVVVDERGKLRAKVVKSISVWNPKPDNYQQSSANIWSATCDAVKEAVKLANVGAEQVKGLGFDATCSLVVLDKEREPLSVSSSTDDNNQNVIMWMDHRALNEADYVTKLGHSLLDQYGKTLSLESDISKVLWLKNNKSKAWYATVGYFFDLPDYMTAKATGNYNTRSLCSLVCKLGYSSSESGHGWDRSFWEQINLKDDLHLEKANNKLGLEIQNPGEAILGGLCKNAAQELGLIEGTSVATSLIDAHSGALALWSCNVVDIANVPLTSRLALICGTSTCHMAIGDTSVFRNGIWGPFYSVILPKLWVQEAGQSAAGKLLDYIINSHPASKCLTDRLPKGRAITDELYTILTNLKTAKGLSSMAHLTEQLHVWPDFHGNRSPLANPTLKGMICGLTIDDSEENLALIYLSTIQSLAYSTRFILNEMRPNGPPIEVILMCGGLSGNSIYVQAHADITGLRVVVPNEEDSVALGAAILGASSTKDFSSLETAMKSMGGEGRTVHPQTDDFGYHEAKYKVFMKMLNDQLEYQEIMKKRQLK